VVFVLVGVNLAGVAERLLAGAENGGDEYRVDTDPKDTGVVLWEESSCERESKKIRPAGNSLDPS